MSDPTATDPNEPRERTASRLRFVAPPGISVRPSPELKTIGRYEVIKTLGKGAMGIVYKARDPLLDRIVAVKTIGSPRGVGRRVRNAYLERFEREAKAAAKMQHPAIVTIFDVGLDNGAPFMVLEYLPGETLADRLDRVRMPLGRAVETALDLASALGFAHKERIVHRDMKPANVLHAGEDRWKLADFGIARLPDSDLTQVGIFMGTPGYSPAEAIREGRYTAQADVFAWGAVLYELLSGYIPYEGPDTRTTNSYVLAAKAKPPTYYDGSIPAPLTEVTMRALSPSPKSRYRDGQTAEAALRHAWQECLTSNLVAPASLAGIEVPHERVGAEMHNPNHQPVAPPRPKPRPHPKAKPDPTPTPLRSDPGVTKIERPSGKRPDKKPVLIIESNNDTPVSDDDPTRLMIRAIDVDDADTQEETALRDSDRVAATENDRDAARKAKAASGKNAVSGKNAAAAKNIGGKKVREATAETPPRKKKTPVPAVRPALWVILALAVVGAGAGAAHYIFELF